MVPVRPRPFWSLQVALLRLVVDGHHPRPATTTDGPMCIRFEGVERSQRRRGPRGPTALGGVSSASATRSPASDIRRSRRAISRGMYRPTRRRTARRRTQGQGWLSIARRRALRTLGSENRAGRGLGILKAPAPPTGTGAQLNPPLRRISLGGCLAPVDPVDCAYTNRTSRAHLTERQRPLDTPSRQQARLASTNGIRSPGSRTVGEKPDRSPASPPDPRLRSGPPRSAHSRCRHKERRIASLTAARRATSPWRGRPRSPARPDQGGPRALR